MKLFKKKANLPSETKYDISNLYVALCTCESSYDKKFYDSFFILEKINDEEFVEVFSSFDVGKKQDGIFFKHFITPIFNTDVIKPVSNFIREGVRKISQKEIFYLQCEMNCIYLPNHALFQKDPSKVFDIYLGKIDFKDL